MHNSLGKNRLTMVNTNGRSAKADVNITHSDIVTKFEQLLFRTVIIVSVSLFSIDSMQFNVLQSQNETIV